MKLHKKHGYLYRYQGKKENSNRESLYRQEHICIAEELLQRPLAKNECVHHLNGIKTDNRPENLLVCTRSFHAKLHHWVKKQVLEANAAYQLKKTELQKLEHSLIATFMQDKFGSENTATLPVWRSDASHSLPIPLKQYVNYN